MSACSDLDPNRLDLVRSSDPAITVDADAMRVLKMLEVDAFIIATPPNAHADLAIAALEAKKPVLCEKPLASSLDDN